MSDYSEILKNDEDRELFVRQRAASLLDLYTRGKLPERDKPELRGYLGGRLPHEKEAPVVAPALVESLSCENPTVPAPVPISRVGLLLKKFAERNTTAGEDEELRRLLPPMPNLLGHLTRGTYKRPLADYARKLGYKTDQTLRRWIDDGRACDPPDLPPFDDFPSLAAWWCRIKRTPSGGVRKVPDELLALAPPAAPVGAPAAVRAAPAVSVPAAPSVTSADFVGGEGYEVALRRARQNERLAAETLDAARTAGEPVKIRAAQDAWTKSFQDLTRAEMNAAEILAAGSDLVSVSEVEATLTTRLESLNQSLRALMVRVFTKVVVPEELGGRLDEAYQKELDRLFGAPAAESAPPPAPGPVLPPFTLERAA